MNVILILLALLLTACGNENSNTSDTDGRQETGLQQPKPETNTCNEQRLHPRDLSGVCVPLMPTMGGGQFRNLFWYDLPDPTKTVFQDGPAFPTYSPDHFLMFGSVPYTQQEGLNGRMCGILLSESQWTQAEILRQATSFFPRINRRFWGVWPLREHTDLNDYSGNGRHLTAQNILSTTTGPELPGIQLPAQVRTAGDYTFRSPVSGSSVTVSASKESWPPGNAVSILIESTVDGVQWNPLGAVTDGGAVLNGRGNQPRLFTNITLQLPPGTTEIRGTLTQLQALRTGLDIEAA